MADNLAVPLDNTDATLLRKELEEAHIALVQRYQLKGWDPDCIRDEIAHACAEHAASRLGVSFPRQPPDDDADLDADLDATDGAHPAWWRGQDYAVKMLCQRVNRVLDGQDDGSGATQEPWESTRRRLLAMAAE